MKIYPPVSAKLYLASTQYQAVIKQEDSRVFQKLLAGKYFWTYQALYWTNFQVWVV